MFVKTQNEYQTEFLLQLALVFDLKEVDRKSAKVSTNNLCVFSVRMIFIQTFLFGQYRNKMERKDKQQRSRVSEPRECN